MKSTIIIMKEGSKMTNYLFKSTLKIEHEERTSTSSTFCLVVEGNKIKLVHVSGTIPHVSDLMRALNECPEILDLYKRVYPFSVEADISWYGRGYYTLKFYPNGVQYTKEEVPGCHFRTGVGFSKKAETMEINSTGKVEDWIGREFYIADFIDFVMEATPAYGMQQEEFLSFKKIELAEREIIKPDIETIKERIKYFCAKETL